MAVAAAAMMLLASPWPASSESILDGSLNGDLDGTLGGRLSGVLPPLRYTFGTSPRHRVCRPYGTGCTFADIQGQPYDCETRRDGCLECRALTLQGSPMKIFWGPQRGWGYCP